MARKARSLFRLNLRQSVPVGENARLNISPTSMSMSFKMGQFRVTAGKTGTTISGAIGNGLRISKRIKKPKAAKAPVEAVEVAQ